MDRRSFLMGAAATAAIPFSALNARVHAQGRGRGQARGQIRGVGYGPLVPALDETTGLPLLALPEGFRYLSFGWTGDIMTNGQPTPGAHDGMAAIHWRGHSVRLVRNHELGGGTAVQRRALRPAGRRRHDDARVRQQSAGEVVEHARQLERHHPQLRRRSDAVGLVADVRGNHASPPMPHGYIFDVPADGDGDPEPIRDMGRFSHEAVAVDPATGYVYETEDAGKLVGVLSLRAEEAQPPQGRRRAVHAEGATRQPREPGRQLSQRRDVPGGVGADSSSRTTCRRTMPGNFVWAQGRAPARRTFARLEGCWYGNDRKIYIVSTSGGHRPGADLGLRPARGDHLRCCSSRPARPCSTRPTTSPSARAAAWCCARTAAARSSCTA